jgi:hypothetical protein
MMLCRSGVASDELWLWDGITLCLCIEREPVESKLMAEEDGDDCVVIN